MIYYHSYSLVSPLYECGDKLVDRTDKMRALVRLKVAHAVKKAH